MPAISRHIAAFFVMGALAACGGGGGGGGNDNGNTPRPDTSQRPPPQTQRPPPQTSNHFDLGTPSTRAAADTALRALRGAGQPLGNINNASNLGQTVSCDLLTGVGCFTPLAQINLNTLPVAAADVKAGAAWDAGWTGKGVKLGVVDDFMHVSGNSPVPHGESTSAVVRQIAPEVSYMRQHIDLGITGTSLTDDITTLDNRMAGAHAALEASDHHIVSNSFGLDRPSGGGVPWATIIAHQLARPGFRKIADPDYTGYYDDAMLFVFSAGNGATRCTGGMENCRPPAAALLELRKTNSDAGERLIYVGSLSDASRSLADADKQLADYSFPPGRNLRNDYIVAHDDIWTQGDGRGTSFSAPRVAGAAAVVRHKFPNLDGAGLKQVLLQTADDLGATGVDDVFGHGALNLPSALSPIGRVRIR